MRFLEASHVVEIMREAGPAGLHIQGLAARADCDPNKLGAFSVHATWLYVADVAENKVIFSGCLRLITSERRFPQTSSQITGFHPLLIQEKTSGRSRQSKSCVLTYDFDPLSVPVPLTNMRAQTALRPS